MNMRTSPRSGPPTRTPETRRTSRKPIYNRFGRITGYFETTEFVQEDANEQESSENPLCGSTSTAPLQEKTSNQLQSPSQKQGATASVIGTDAKISRLIKIVRDCPNLHKRNFSAKQKSMKEKLWRIISGELGMTESWCITTWESLRRKYRYEMKRRIENGHASDDSKEFIEKMSFLPYHSRKTTTNKCKKSPLSISVNGMQLQSAPITSPEATTSRHQESSHSDAQTSTQDTSTDNSKSDQLPGTREIVLDLQGSSPEQKIELRAQLTFRQGVWRCSASDKTA